MRILAWTGSFWPHIGGVEVLGQRLFEALTQRGHQIMVLTRQDTADLPERSSCRGIPVVRLPIRQALEQRDLATLTLLKRRAAELTREFAPDVIYVYHAGPEVLLQRQLAGSWPASVVVSLHQSYPDAATVHRALFGQTLRSANWIIACSESVLEATRRQIPEIGGVSSAISNTLPLPAVAPTPLAFDPPRIVCLGRATPQKGFDYALSSFAELLARFPALEMIVAGDGDALPKLRAQAKRLRIDERVEFLGWVAPQEVPGCINRATIVLMPSRHEPFGLVALEAAQMGRPIVASRVGGLPEVVLDGRTGFLVEPGNVERITQAVATLLEDPSLARQMGRQAREHAEQYCRWDDYVAAHELVLRQAARHP